MNKQAGFSLIELMITVAIIGILATIAVPQYNVFQRKARQTDVKTNLSNMYATEVIFITEWDYGTANLQQMGFNMEGETYYRMGWHTRDHEAKGVNVNTTTRPAGYNGPLATNTGMVNTARLGIAYAPGANDPIPGETGHMRAFGTCKCTGTDCGSPTTCVRDNSSCTPSGGGNGQCSYKAGGVDNSNLPDVTFTISARGNIGGSKWDRWTIDQSKVLTNIQNGTQ